MVYRLSWNKNSWFNSKNIWQGFKRGNLQGYKNAANINPLTNISNPIYGEGSYLMPDINEAKLYTCPISYKGNNFYGHFNV